jgi:hypothetical protein
MGGGDAVYEAGNLISKIGLFMVRSPGSITAGYFSRK